MSLVERKGCFDLGVLRRVNLNFPFFLALIIWLYDYIVQILLEDLHIGVTKMDFILSPKKTWPKLLVTIVKRVKY